MRCNIRPELAESIGGRIAHDGKCPLLRNIRRGMIGAWILGYSNTLRDATANQLRPIDCIAAGMVPGDQDARRGIHRVPPDRSLTHGKVSPVLMKHRR